VKKSKQLVCNFPHGFVSEKIVLPEDFCLAGLQRFLNEYLNWGGLIDDCETSTIAKGIYVSLENREDTQEWLGWIEDFIEKKSGLNLDRNLLGLFHYPS
jgi:hypothetical protein